MFLVKKKKKRKISSFSHFLLLVFSFFSIVSLAYAATTLGNNIFTSGTLTSQGKAYLTGGVSTPVLNATSSLIDNLSVNNLRATSTLDYWLANAPTTDNLREGTKNLYYTDQRVANYVNNNSFLTVSTTNLIAQNALLSQATIPVLNSTSSLIDNLTITNTTTANHINLPDTVATAGNKGIIYKEGVPFLYNFSYGTNANGITLYGHNLFLGKDAGNLTMGSTATALGQSSFNVGIGKEALSNNTTGYQNTALGFQSLFSNTTGYRNAGIGTQTLYFNTTGINNIAVGHRCLYHNSSGAGNVGVGTTALYNNTTGSYNMALGGSALGSNIGGSLNVAIGNGALYNSLGSSNIGIGFSTEPLAADDNNEIIIGTRAVGAGSNSVVLGNDDITKTLLKGNVAIGTTTPTATLTVVGDSYLDGTVTTPLLYATSSLIDNLTVGKQINLSDTIATAGNKGIIYKDGAPFLYDFGYGTNANGITPYGQNIFLGKGAGNLAMGSTAVSVVQSSYNIGIGTGALYSNTTGYSNVGMGHITLYHNTTGAGNMAIGNSALFANTTGNSNMAIGSGALFNNITGSNSIALGSQAGRYTSTDAANSYSSDCVYLGSATKSLSASDYNEIVIGYNAVGAGSNSVVLGNDDITKTLLKGNVGIASTTPEEALTVGGNIYASGTVMSTNLSVAKTVTSTNISLAKVKFTPTATPTNPAVGDCFMDNGAKPQVSCYDGTTWHTLW